MLGGISGSGFPLTELAPRGWGGVSKGKVLENEREGGAQRRKSGEMGQRRGGGVGWQNILGCGGGVLNVDFGPVSCQMMEVFLYPTLWQGPPLISVNLQQNLLISVNLR